MNQAWIKYLPASLRKVEDGLPQIVVSNTGWQFADNILDGRSGMASVRVPRSGTVCLLSHALAFGALFLLLTAWA
jgi:hypothetical protein